MGISNFVRRQYVQLAHRRPFQLGETGPLVSFTFDDFPRTAYTCGGMILKDFGVRGTYYTAAGLMNGQGPSGDHFVLEDLILVVADGHELASHTFSHISSYSVPAGAYFEDVCVGRESLRKMPNLVVSDNFAFPFGAVTAASKLAVGKNMRSCRSTLGGVNGALVDLNLLRANALYGDTEQVGRVERLLDETARTRGWLIFYTHDVRKDYSPYGCSPRLFELAVKAATRRSMEIVTIEEVTSRS